MRGEADDASLRALQAAKQCLARLFASAPDDLQPETGGLSNTVFRARLAGAEMIVRVGEADSKLDVFRREERVTHKVREAGIPAPEVLCVTEEEGLAVMVARALPGAVARDHPERLRTLEDLGALAAQRIHAIRTFGFGGDFRFEPDGSALDWRGWLLGEYDADARIRILAGHGLISFAQEDALRRTLDRMAALPAEAVLNHGDLRLKNVLVDEAGAIVGLLDWENCVSVRGPYWDISVALHDLWVDQAQAFLGGYGMDEQAVRLAAPFLRLFNTLNYAPEVERSVKAGDHETLERIRLRFSGALDLFIPPE